MAHIITIILGVVSSVLTFIVTSLLKENHKLREKKKEEEETKDRAISEALLCMLRKDLSTSVKDISRVTLMRIGRKCIRRIRR